VRAKLETAQGEVERARESLAEARRALELLLGRYPAAEMARSRSRAGTEPKTSFQNSVQAVKIIACSNGHELVWATAR
jgi:outer membrane protein TolC